MNYQITTQTGKREIVLTWPLNTRRLGILVSGGLDSALLFWMWAQEIIPPNCELVALTTDRGNGSVEFATRIVSHVNSISNKKIQHIILSVTNQAPHYKQVSTPVRQAIIDGVVDWCNIASTSNPQSNIYGIAPGRVDLDLRYSVIGFDYPLLHCDKSHTIGLVYQLKLFWIPTMSHTCTETSGLRCGVCWQCNERAWGFNALRLVDPGAC